MTTITNSDHVHALLDLAGVVPTDAEVANIIEAFPTMQAQVDRLWAVDLGESVPALVFRAAETAGPAEVARG